MGYLEGYDYDGGGGSFTFEKQEEGDDNIMGDGAEKNFINAVKFLKQVKNYQPNYYGTVLGSMFLDNKNDIVFELN